MTRKIHYEPHPVSPERQAELSKMGVLVLDARFDPNPAPKAAAKPAPKRRVTKNDSR